MCANPQQCTSGRPAGHAPRPGPHEGAPRRVDTVPRERLGDGSAWHERRVPAGWRALPGGTTIAGRNLTASPRPWWDASAAPTAPPWWPPQLWPPRRQRHAAQRSRRAGAGARVAAAPPHPSTRSGGGPRGGPSQAATVPAVGHCSAASTAVKRGEADTQRKWLCQPRPFAGFPPPSTPASAVQRPAGRLAPAPPTPPSWGTPHLSRPAAGSRPTRPAAPPTAGHFPEGRRGRAGRSHAAPTPPNPPNPPTSGRNATRRAPPPRPHCSGAAVHPRAAKPSRRRHPDTPAAATKNTGPQQGRDFPSKRKVKAAARALSPTPTIPPSPSRPPPLLAPTPSSAPTPTTGAPQATAPAWPRRGGPLRPPLPRPRQAAAPPRPPRPARPLPPRRRRRARP